MPSPRPRVPPVTTTLRITTDQLAGAVHAEAGDEVDCRGNLVPRQRLATMPQQLFLDLGHAAGRALGDRLELDVRDDERAGDRTLSCAHARHPHARMAVQHRFDFLGMDLEPADVDDAAAAADEVVTLTASLDHVSGVHEAVGAEQRLVARVEIAARGAPRTNAKRAVLRLHLRTTIGPRAEQARRKAGATVADVEGDAGLRRREGVSDLRVRVARAQTIENRLVRDLARQTHILRRDAVGGRAHERATPVRR